MNRNITIFIFSNLILEVDNSSTSGKKSSSESNDNPNTGQDINVTNGEDVSDETEGE